MERCFVFNHKELQGIKMKIYLCPTEPVELTKSTTWISNLATFNGVVGDSEATSIVCDFFLSSFKYEELQGVLNKIVSKMRLNSELILIHPDINILSQRLVREEVDTQTFNNILFKAGGIKSVFPMEDVERSLPSSVQVTHKHFDALTSQIILTARRTA